MLKLSLLILAILSVDAFASERLSIAATVTRVEDSPYQGPRHDQPCPSNAICLAWAAMYIYYLKPTSPGSGPIKAAMLSHEPYWGPKSACWRITLRRLSAKDARWLGAQYEILYYSQIGRSKCTVHGPNNSFNPTAGVGLVINQRLGPAAG